VIDEKDYFGLFHARDIVDEWEVVVMCGLVRKLEGSFTVRARDHRAKIIELFHL